jgi:hypothetical protein
MPEQIFMKIGMYIVVPEPISMVYFVSPSSHSVCLYVPMSLLGDGSAYKFLL